MVRDHLSSSLLTLDEMDTLRDSARLLKRARITGAPVLDGSSLSGIMSRNDLLRAIDQVPSDTTPEAFETQIGEIQEQNVWQVMADSPITIPPEVSLMAAARKMQEKKLNRLMVKGQYSSMLGIISSTDVVFTMLGTDATAAASVDPSQYEYKAELDAEETEECALGSCVRGHMATDLVCMKADMTLKEVACACGRCLHSLGHLHPTHVHSTSPDGVSHAPARYRSNRSAARGTRDWRAGDR